MSSNKKPKPGCFKIIFTSIIITAIFTFITFTALPSAFFKKPRTRAKKYSCFSNIRVLTGAVEMYNMDYPGFIKELNDSTIELLIEGKYLKNRPVLPEGKCEYLSKDDLSTENGFIFCRYHGDILGKVKNDYEEFVEKENRRTEMKKKLLLICFCCGPTIFYLLMNAIEFFITL